MPKTSKSGAVIISAGGSMKPYFPKRGVTLKGDEMRDIVGGFIEIVSDGKFSMVLDEEGKIKGKQPNRKATALARGMGLIYPTDWIAGDAILCPSAMIR